MLTVLRRMGMPPVLIGAMKVMGKDIPDEQLREMSARVAVGMLRIYVGVETEEALSMESLTAPNMDLLIEGLTRMRDNGKLISVEPLAGQHTQGEGFGDSHNGNLSEVLEVSDMTQYEASQRDTMQENKTHYEVINEIGDVTFTIPLDARGVGCKCIMNHIEYHEEDGITTAPPTITLVLTDECPLHFAGTPGVDIPVTMIEQEDTEEDPDKDIYAQEAYYEAVLGIDEDEEDGEDVELPTTVTFS